MKKYFLFIVYQLINLSIITLCLSKGYAQSVGINNTGAVPDASAMLDVNHPNKGLLVPRVALTATNVAAPVTTPATSLLVYNTETIADVTPGYYYWSGTAWVRLATGTPSGGGTGWLLTGNAGTVDGTNFIGTTDDVPFNIRVNNQKAGRIDNALVNTFWGYQAGNANTTGSANTANGFRALFSNTSGGNNTANGFQALFSNTSGLNNTANGVQALLSNTTGSVNTANGFQALRLNTTGFANTANGTGALERNTEGNNNTACGQRALFYNTTGSSNTANGVTALFATTTGDANTANGIGALYNNITGNGNTALGYAADVSSSNLNNATAIGSLAIVSASNKIRLGDDNVTVIEGQVAYSFPSDARFKYNIKSNVPGLDFIKKLTPVTYYFDEKKLEAYTKTGILRQAQDDIAKYASYTGEKQLHTGFLAQDVERIANELGYNFDGVHAPANDKDHYSLAYSQFIMPLVKGMQEQQILIETLKQENEAAKEIIQIQKNDLEIIKTQVAELIKSVKTLTDK